MPFDIIGALAYDVDGAFDEKKAKLLVRLFRPDKYDEVSLLNFVASCEIKHCLYINVCYFGSPTYPLIAPIQSNKGDSVYKRLRVSDCFSTEWSS